MESEENTLKLEKLLDKRRKLIDLRKKLTSQGQIEVETTGLMDTLKENIPDRMKQDEKNTNEDVKTIPALQLIVQPSNSTSIIYQDPNVSDTDNIASVESYISLDPPSYSPITPRNTNNDNILKIHSDWFTEASPSPDLQNKPEEIVQDSSKNGFQRIEDSPVRAMSPATLGLLNTLLSGSDDDDDSVKDPNYIVSESSDISDTESESILLPRSITQEQNMEEECSNNLNKDLGEETRHSTCEEEPFAVNNVSSEEETTEKRQSRPKRGRKRKFNDYTLAQRKSRKYANLPYRGKNKEVNARTFKNYTCVCKKQCHLNVTEEDRKKEFNKFITLGSYEAQLLYICSNVTETRKKRSYISENTSSQVKKPRNFSRTYKISNIAVCRDMFLNTFQVTTQKITISLKKQRDGNLLRDCRGLSSGGWNKTPEEKIDFVCHVINKLPKYKSHYRRTQNGAALYLQPGLTIQKIYDLYVDEFKLIHGNDSKDHVSLAIFRKIFLKNFNLRFKSLKKDTCNRCDTFAAKLKAPNDLSIENRNQLIAEKEKHLKLAETLRSQMNSQIERAKVDETFECLTFDMEKTLPLPRIPTNIVFYKRQLWFYNCGVHVSSTNQGYCFVWVEGQAGRGAQEVGSCLKKFINEVMRPNVEYLSLWSDSCGGQNRNIKMVLLLKVILASHPTLKVIDLNFLESGHTFLPNDTDFGKIESHLKNFQRLYTAEDYVNVIKTCTKKTPLVPVKMEKEDFVSTEKLEKNITNRKLFVNKLKVNWLRTKHIQLRKDNVHSIFMRSDDIEEYQELYIGRKFKGSMLPLSSELLIPLWPDGKPITQAKLNDIKSMFNLIPEDCLSFYKNLQGMEGPDYVEGFSGGQDFNFEDDEEELV
ncbi:uncharacterized protein LOC111349897 [Spodoptera litura]|uniref:Uncharacterized protein LOC111349897 n=1 Tax=Spodoptera litura TaxID=69820 RepID=A0A9J7DVR2_SPOLT|nr:uncharacterized protein LOC111349897 [Spodoptera litura]